jgi:hypothetical protein
MPHKNMSVGSAAPHRKGLALSETDLQSLDGHPLVVRANKKLSRALEEITGWKLAGQGGIPKDKFKAAAKFEDALGLLKESLILATHDWIFHGNRPKPNSRPKPSRKSNPKTIQTSPP